jgi:CobQ-like glutamine amidotransferase family enzyme
MRLVLCQLYPEHLSIYADRGNVMVLRKRCAWRGIELVERPLRPGEQLEAAEIDLFLLGGGQDRDQLLVAEDLQRHRAALAGAIADGATMLGVCGGYQLLGHVYRGHLGDDMRGLGLLDLETNAGTTRMIGNVVLESDLGDGRRTIVGFENHAGRTTLAPDLAPLGRVLSGNGNDGESGYEGARAGRVLGTYVHGPLLPKNAWLADWLIREALDRRYGTVELEPLDDGLEERAHAAAARIRA